MTAPPDFIDLLCGWPNPALLPAPDLLRSATTVLTTPDITNPALQYGPDEGYEPLRAHVAHWLETFYQPCDRISLLRICITGGASQNLACVLQVFTDPLYTRTVWMVEPTYHLAGRIFDDAGFDGRVHGVPENDEGLDLEFLEAGLQAAEKKAAAEGNTEPKIKLPRPWRKIYKHVIYGVPTFANPSGKIMSVGHREELVRLARRYDALLVTDDVYDMLQWPSTPGGDPAQTEHPVAPRLVDVDRYLDGGPVDEWGHTISNGSFSKLISPGARTGWAEASEKLAYGLSQVGSSRSGGAPSQLSAACVDQLLATGFLETYVRDTLRPAYGDRYHRMIAAIEEYLVPHGVSVPEPPGPVAGGYFIWIKLPSDVDAADVVRRAQREENLRLAPGTLFQVIGDQGADKNRFSDRLRLCFAWAEPQQLTEGVRRLGALLGRMV
ncbi:hypothetical protein N7468_002374 [Penicillium chermesinum]|uniref:Aminotransferase class I/classII large domain-containing protein n=1 Tax=Penicillium chermesinum TaxID=63820 RepID=A0A9W9PK09_9EURO|nr:uncharacterized protein N7468_002374 [Penicillium chermesinum]KAJ5247391.1 hypothetical protein N7468_002374 [Penicillium chermesinum]KAJ6145633.1 hypothetical protein N7470_009528 [Penicillium chermesinum]